MGKYDDEDDQFSELRKLMRQKREQTDSHPSVENSDKDSKEEKEAPAEVSTSVKPVVSSRKKGGNKSSEVINSEGNLRKCTIYLSNEQFFNLKLLSLFFNTNISSCVRDSLSSYLKEKESELRKRAKSENIDLL